MSTGMLGWLGVGVESSGGASATGTWSATVNVFVPFISETLANVRNDLESQVIQDQFDTVRMYTGLQTVGGNVVTEAHPINTGVFLRACFDQTTTTTSLGYLGITSHANVRAHSFKALNTQFQQGSGSDLPTLTIEVGRGPLGSSNTSFIYYNCAGNTLEIQVQAGQLATITTDFVGREYGRKSETSTTFPSAEAFLWSQASVQIGGNGSGIFESLTVRLNNNLSAFPALNGRLRPDLIKRTGFRTVEVNGSITFQSNSDYDLFIGGSETSLRVTFTGPGISTSPANNAIFDIQVPAFRYTAFPININGPGRIAIPFQGRGMWHSGSGTCLEICLVNTRTTPYLS